MIGAGIYDNIALAALSVTNADGVVLIVIKGNCGSGASVKISPELIPVVAKVLRDMAGQIEADSIAALKVQNAPTG